MSRIRQLIVPLRHAALRRVFVAQAASGFGDWAGRLALAVLVYQRSESAAWAAAVTIVSLLPWMGPGQLLATGCPGRVDLRRPGSQRDALVDQPCLYRA